MSAKRKKLLLLAATICASSLTAAGALASARPIEGWGPFRLYQNIPRMQNPRFLPKYDLVGFSLESYEERFEAGRMFRTYRCLEELPCERRKSVQALLTLDTVDGKLLHISLVADFAREALSTAPPAARPAVSAGSSTGVAESGSAGAKGGGEGAADSEDAQPGEPDERAGWEARKELGSSTFKYQINYLFDRYLGRKPQNEDLQQYFDGEGPHYSSIIQSPGSEKEWIELTFYPELPVLLIDVSTKEWDGLQAKDDLEASDGSASETETP